MRASQRGPPGVCVKYRHNKAPLLPCPRTILTHFFPFSLHSPTSPPAFIIHPQVPFGLPAFPLLGSNHFLLQLYASVGSPPHPPHPTALPHPSSGALFYYPAQVKRSTGTESLTLGLAVLLSPASCRPPQLLPGRGEGICWGWSLGQGSSSL